MADNRPMEKITVTQLYSKPFWNPNDKGKNKRLVINLLNNSTQFVIQGSDAEGKFSNGPRVAVTMNNFEEAAFIAMVKEIQNRMVRIVDKNEDVKKEALVYYTGQSIKEAKQKIELNIYSNEDKSKGKFTGYIKLAKRKEDDSFEEAMIWFGSSKSYYRSSESANKPAKDYEIYHTLESIAVILEAVLARTSITRDSHLKRMLSSNNGESGNDTSKNNNSYSGSDDFDF